MAGGGADQLAAFFGQQFGDGLRIFAAQRLAGEDHHAGVDVVRPQFGGGVGLIDDGAKARAVDVLLAQVRRERHRRTIQRLARRDVIAAGEILAEAAQMHFGEDDLRAGRSDVDADAHERDVVGDPERILLGRQVRFEIVVIVIGVAVVDMGEAGAVIMIRERVRALWFSVLGLRIILGHQDGSARQFMA